MYITDESNITYEKEIMVGKKRAKNSLSNYFLTLDTQDPLPKGGAYSGKLKMMNKKVRISSQLRCYDLVIFDFDI